MKKLILFLLFGFISAPLWAQLSNGQIMKIKEDADDGKSLWIKLFDDSYQNKNMSSLPALRNANENFLNEHISILSRMYAEGDGRELIVAVKNYLVIQRQFVKDVMIPAESLNPEDEEGYNALGKKISDFALKERSFDMDITNALRSSREPIRAEPQETDEPEDEPIAREKTQDDEEADDGEEASSQREKLPHERYDEGKKKRRRR